MITIPWIENDTKVCPICMIEKTIEDFPVSRGKRSGGRQAYCTPCGRLNAQLRHHHMTLNQYREMLENQQGKCLVCLEIMVKPEIDHDHSCCPTSKSCGSCTRGLLCKNCNRMIGWARDDAQNLVAGALYLTSKEACPGSSITGITLEEAN